MASASPEPAAVRAILTAHFRSILARCEQSLAAQPEGARGYRLDTGETEPSAPPETVEEAIRRLVDPEQPAFERIVDLQDNELDGIADRLRLLAARHGLVLDETSPPHRILLRRGLLTELEAYKITAQWHRGNVDLGELDRAEARVARLAESGFEHRTQAAAPEEVAPRAAPPPRPPFAAPRSSRDRNRTKAPRRSGPGHRAGL